MPEEKKESFTFSDKIKNSKSVENKSFAKSSSKIGRDGKPKATLFQRTRRDAPFFIAALIALLLLPFLYKYSGPSGEEKFLTPSAEDSVFDPDFAGLRDGMTFVDPENQIAQLSGRDSLCLIKGTCDSDEEEIDSSYRDGLEDEDDYLSSEASASAEGRYDAERHSSSEMDVEENTTNIYKRRAKAGARRAFRRTAIGTLNPAGMPRRGGGGLGVKNWGGSMKNAANKVKPSTPAQAPKPVSLQPLRAGSGRSAFGQGAGLAARKSLDNMGKRNPHEALRDAYVKPVDPVRVGGLDMFSVGPGGGSGKFDRNINITPGKEPWWWDMMKTRMQKEWEKRFERKWGWITFWDDLAKNILKGLVNCIITGDSDGDPDHFLGDISVGGSGTGKKECCGMNEKQWTASHPNTPFTSDACKGWMKTEFGETEYKKRCPNGWVDKTHAGASVRGPIAQRLCCLGLCGGVYASGDLGLGHSSGLDCTDMPNYSVVPSGKARKWNIYTYVVVRNYAPQALVDAKKITLRNTRKGGQYLLCGSSDRRHGGTSLEHNQGTAGVGDVSAKNEGQVENVIVEGKKSSRVTTEQQQVREKYLEYDQESLRDACVIVVSRGNVLPYEQVKNQIIDLFMKKYNVDNTTAAKAFFQLDLMYVESFATKHKLAYAQWFETGHQLVKLLPMPYWEFENAYINHRKVTHKLDGSRDKVYKTKWRIENVDMVKGPKCFYGLQVDCGPDDSARAFVRFNKESFGGGNPGIKPDPKGVTVSAEFRYLNHGQEGANRSVVQPMTNIPGISNDGYTFTYTFSNIIDSDKITNTSGIKHSTDGKWDLVGNIVWTVVRGEEVVTKNCPLNLSGDIPTPPIEDKQCKSPQESEKCCLEMLGSYGYEWDPSQPVGQRCVKKVIDECPDKENTNQKCCADIMGPDYIFDPNHNPKCYKPESPTKKPTRLAPVLSWVPYQGKVDCRGEMDNQTVPTEDIFNRCGKVPGIQKNVREHCGSQTPMMMDSQAAANFVQGVVKAYNKQNPNATKVLSDKFYSGAYPTDGEFVDALYLAQKVGIQDVPASAVCELGRDMVRMSRDKHTKEMRVANPMSTPYVSEGWKDKNTVFHNELGAFLAYIHLESIFYPQKYFGTSAQCDYRFMVEDEGTCHPMVNWKQEQCIHSSGKVCKEYHHNNYNNIPKAGGQATAAYPKSLAPIQAKATYPLKELVQGKETRFPEVGNSGGSTKGKRYIDNISLLIREGSGFTAWKGNACVAYTGPDATLKVEDALKYVETVCSVGLDYKPYGTPGKSSGSSPAPGTPGADVGGEANPQR